MTTTIDQAPGTTTVVDRFLAAIQNGQGATMGELYAPDATLDATVPGWRFHVKGADAIVRQYSGWFADVGKFEELDRQSAGDVEFVTYLIAAEDNGVPYVAHHCHRLTFDRSGLIASDQVFCGGRWNAALLAEMAEADAKDAG